MTDVGIERMGLYCGAAFVDVAKLAAVRGLDPARFANLLMRRKSVAFRFEDPVSFAVNAARPMIDALSPAERSMIDLLVVATESGIDWGKSISNYAHRYLELPRHCRMFEVKQACYGGTAALRTAASLVAAGEARRALVISTDVARCVPHSYAEPSQGCAAVALLVGRNPVVLALEAGASGVHGYEVMDSCRPTAETETGDVDLSLLSYLDCIERSFLAYRDRVGAVDFRDHFAYLACHTPFGGMVKGAHRTMMRKFSPGPPQAVNEDFERRVRPALAYCQEVGNIYSGTVFLALAGALAHGDYTQPQRIGLFSYGSGCCSEFYSGMATAASSQSVRALDLDGMLAGRRELDMTEYDALLADEAQPLFGLADVRIDAGRFTSVLDSHFAGTGRLVLDGVVGYQRQYRWA
ncbi:hydroxymethylglutaryl-CoA synthase family protein [Marinivivus vitaminiproducens]|uniref:hydroxymethylglutaryl-CoA synthase family protein n=1 Tax=Marinivivus vitaminiproducens TaxID=3035935 RepID=UPI00279BC6BF|nr:hydroxymethylglutaryl-CoA synthase [Geminicoccaceae bacterium SCSIO 64248]